LAQIVEVSEEQRSMAVEQLAARLVERCGAPDLATARAAAEEEIAFAASLCAHPPGMLVAVSRRYENEEIRESFRTLQANSYARPAPVFSFVQVDEEAAPSENIDLVGLIDRARQ
jgi:hypothetical protein